MDFYCQKREREREHNKGIKTPLYEITRLSFEENAYIGFFFSPFELLYSKFIIAVNFKMAS